MMASLNKVSHFHDCNFCTTAHRAFGKAASANSQTIAAIMSNEEIECEKDKAMVDLIVTMLERRGWVSEQDLAKFYAAGFSQRNVYDLILVITIKTLSNYANHLTKPELNPEIISML